MTAVNEWILDSYYEEFEECDLVSEEESLPICSNHHTLLLDSSSASGSTNHIESQHLDLLGISARRGDANANFFFREVDDRSSYAKMVSRD